jgi:hypothetical protein
MNAIALMLNKKKVLLRVMLLNCRSHYILFMLKCSKFDCVESNKLKLVVNKTTNHIYKTFIFQTY